MAITAQTAFTISDSLRENFSNIVTIIDPTERPFQANIETQTVTNPDEYKWQNDSLDTEDVTNAYLDGAVFAYENDGAVTGDIDAVNDASTPSLLKARCQISRRHVSVSRRSMKADKAGMGNNLSYQLVRRGQELLRDREAILLANQDPAGSSATQVPKLAGLPVWLKTNTSRDSGGADPSISNNEPTGASALDGTARAISEGSHIQPVLESIYTNSSASADLMGMVGVTMKRRISSFLLSGNSRSATQYQDAGARPSGGLTVAASVDNYIGDYQRVTFVANRFQRAEDMFFLNTDLFEIGIFDDMEIEEQGVDGDKEDYMILSDYTLISRDESGSGVVADCDTTAAVTV